MPLYVYEEILPDGHGGETFEVIQSLNDPPLTTHPESGRPVRRVLSSPNTPRAWTSSQMKANLSDKNIERLGFTKYVKSEDGTYEKMAGQGPNLIRRKR